MNQKPTSTIAYIALGSNISPRRQHIQQAIQALNQHPAVNVVATSTLIETAPVGGPQDQGPFINAAAALLTTLDPPQLLHLLQQIEIQLGRQRTVPWGPRTIDLDLLIFNQTIIDTPALQLPHPLMHTRRFVLEPLSQIAPGLVHPQLKKTIQQLLDDLPPAAAVPHLIAVAGIVGVGKSTLAQALAQKLNAQFIPEEYNLNPFLAHQRQGDQEAALASELFFLLSRARQLDHRNIFSPLAVTDYIFQKNRIFAELSLTPAQLSIFNQLEATTLKYIIAPQAVVFLHDTIDNCLTRIQKRARPFERDISAGWLTKLDQAYRRLLDNWTTCPVIPIDCAALDIRTDSAVTQITQQIKNS